MNNWSCAGWRCRTLVGLGCALIAALLLSALGSLHPLLEAIATIRVQLIPLAIVPLVGFALLRRWNFAALAFILLATLSLPMVPYWFATPDERVEGSVPITVMQFNVYFGNDDVEAIAEHIADADADVVALHELLPDQWRALEPLLVDHPYRIAEPLAETDGQPGGGMALISKTPMSRRDVPADMSPPTRVTLVATTVIEGETIEIVGLHPHASRTDEAKISLRETQVDGVVALAASSAHPMIVLTDLNATPTSPLYGGFLRETGWVDPHRKVGWQSTWPTWGGPFGIPIDHVLVSNDFSIHAMRTGHGAGSDHKSLVAEISLPARE